MINLAKYPIEIYGDSVLSSEPGSTETRDIYLSLTNSCIAQMNEQGFVSLPNFLSTDAIYSLTTSISELEQQGVGFYSGERHNVFLEDSKGNCNFLPPHKSDSYSPIHPRGIQLQSSKLVINAHHLAPHAPELDALFHSKTFLDFISTILQTQLYPSADKYGKYYANIFHEGDGLNWHFDRSEYSISLILQPAEEGGMFQFAPNSRKVIEEFDEMPMTIEGVSDALLAASNSTNQICYVKEPKLTAGDLYLFRGQNALHRVSEIRKGRRINLILTFNSEPDATLNEYTLQKFFGVGNDVDVQKKE